MPFTLTGKTALVTGSGRGIGRAIARTLAGCGASVMVTDIDGDAAAEAESAIRAQGGVAAFQAGDITRPEMPGQIVEGTLRAFGGLDIIVNNAGYTWDSVIQKTTDEQFQTMLDIHVVAPFRVLRAASDFLRDAAKKETAEGRRVMRKVVNITSIAGTDGNAGQVAYSSAKSAVVGLTKTMAKEWGRYNINVNSVGFGIIETRLIAPGEEGAIEVAGRKIRVGVQAQALEALRNDCPLGRLGTVQEAADAVLFFCSPLSDYVTGELLICGGGLHF